MIGQLLVSGNIVNVKMKAKLNISIIYMLEYHEIALKNRTILEYLRQNRGKVIIITTTSIFRLGQATNKLSRSFHLTNDLCTTTVTLFMFTG